MTPLLEDGPLEDRSAYFVNSLDNIDAADSINTDQLWSGGVLGLELDGEGYIVGIWDKAWVRTTHVEFNEGETSRVELKEDSWDSEHPKPDHSTHVAGTIGAAGARYWDPHSIQAKGSAPGVLIWSYEFDDDLAELAAAASSIVASNHSYSYISGWKKLGSLESIDRWYGDRSRYMESELFGKYDTRVQQLDEVLYDNPYLVSVWSAGNNRADDFTNRHGDGRYQAYFKTDPGYGIEDWHGADFYEVSSEDFPPPGPDGDFDTLPPRKTAKNNIVVGAINDIRTGDEPYGPEDVQIMYFSGFGPTDDGRIKPDVVANGNLVWSTIAQGDYDYYYATGTSFSTPSVTGAVVLLVQHFDELFPYSPRSATVKSLLIHTAFDQAVDAPDPGPNYSYGWGVVNAAAAAQFLSEAAEADGTAWLNEASYSGSAQTYTFYSDGSVPLKATMVWTDPEGTPHGSTTLDQTTPVLVNDLDLWITAPDGTYYYPCKLDPANPGYAATRPTDTEYDSDKLNHLDNVVQVMIDAPAAGVYTVHVGHTGDNFTQDYSLLVSGGSDPAFPHVDGMVINDDRGAQYSRSVLKIELDFSENVNSTGSLDASDLVLYYHDGDAYDEADTSEAVLGSYDSETDTVTWDFTGCRLPDGWYKAGTFLTGDVTFGGGS